MTDLAALFEAAHRQIRRRSMVVIVSDFISAPGWEKPLHLLNRRHEVLAVRLERPARERAARTWARSSCEDAETGEQLVRRHPRRARSARRFAEAAAARARPSSRGRSGGPASTP